VGGTIELWIAAPDDDDGDVVADGWLCAVQVDKRNRKAQGPSPVLPACLPTASCTSDPGGVGDHGMGMGSLLSFPAS